VIDAWRAKGRFIEVQGLRVFVVERNAEAENTIAILHGFPSWTADFALVLDALSAKHRVVLHDHIGFGLSAKPTNYSYSLLEQADIAIGVWRFLGLNRVHLMAHDYGTSVATELVARRERGLLPIELRSLTLTNGSVHLELAQLRLAQKLMLSPLGPIYARLANKRLFMRNMRAILRKPVDDAHLVGMWEALAHDNGKRLLPRISGYQHDRQKFSSRWIGALTRLDIPAHILWGDDDPVAVRAIGDKLASEIPTSRYTRLPGVGHYPMLEDPSAWSSAAVAFFSSL
jgi:pimeloyl-ACP methyl ester carboxylesterase